MITVTNIAALPAYCPKGPIVIELDRDECDQLHNILDVYAAARPRNTPPVELNLAISLSYQLLVQLLDNSAPQQNS